MSPTERLEQPFIEKALDDEIVGCAKDEMWRGYRRQPSPLARRAVS